jgi:hypothetical protein
MHQRDSHSRNTHSTIHYRSTDDADADGHHDGAKVVAEERHDEISPSHHHDDDHKGKRKESEEIDEVAA